ncbi:uncharacterized protein [Asterias amurensis]|uniref:uncharacterized protein isoform X2 n=1 Tax=Asterias amurensis TaxID=7602 RepID=UPI003AB66887
MPSWQQPISLSEIVTFVSKMADKVSDPPDGIIVRNKLECAFCKKRLKNPKILQCLHNVCEQCLLNKVSMGYWSITCPLCYQTTTSSNGVQNLKTNFHLIGQLEDTLVKEELLREESLNNQPVCESCEVEKEAVSRCLDCSMYLCLSCKKVHRRIAVLSKHTVASLDELRVGVVTKTFRREKRAEECPSDHRFFCETCNDVVCKDCPEIDPRSGKSISPGWRGASRHKVVKMDSAASSKRKMTKQMITSLQKVLGEYKSTLKSIAVDRANLEGQSRGLEEQVKEAVRAITKKIKEEEARHVKEIADIQQRKEKTLQESEKCLKAAMQRMSDSLEMAINVTDTASDQDFLGLVSLINNNLEDLTRKGPDRIYSGLPHWTFTRENSGRIGGLMDPSGRSYSCNQQCDHQSKGASIASSAETTRKCSPLKRVPVQPHLPSKYLPKPTTVSATTKPFTTSPPEAPKFTFTKTTVKFGSAASSTPAGVFGSAASSTPAAVFGWAASSTPAAVFGGGALSTPAAVFGGAASSTPAAVFGGGASSTPAAVFGGAASSTPAAVLGSAASKSPPAKFGSAASSTPAGLLTYGNAFPKYDLGASFCFTSSARSLTTPKSETVAAAPSTAAPSTAAPSTAAPSTAAPSKSQIQALTQDKQDQSKEILPSKKGTRFAFGAVGLSSQTLKSSAPPALSMPSEEKSMGLNFAAMAKTKASYFSFRMDVSNTQQEAPEKSLVNPKSSGVVKLAQQPQSPILNQSVEVDPFIELPECIEVRTGEEGEEVRFSHRAKLFRYHKESAQWKECGIGDIKVLFNPDTKKYRIVMRREQVLKVCANHFVTPELKLQPMAGSTKSWVWMAMDAPEGEVHIEQLAVRFKTEELAQQFKEAVEAAQEDMKTGGGDAVKIKDGDNKEDKTEKAEKEDTYVDEDEDDDEDDNGVDEGEGEEDEGANGDGEEEQDATEQGDEKDEDEQNKPTQGGEEREATTQGDDVSPTFKSYDPNVLKSFSELLRNANASHAQKQKEMSEAESSSKDEEAAGSSINDSMTEERDDIHFYPIVQLPEQLEKITGEEDENQLFCSRAKLYRYDKTSSQWKDRGVGDIKILQNVKTGRYRILMRRDQVFRVCANHYITKDMALLPNAGSENSLVWRAMDASDGEPQPEQLAVRFKLAGTTQRFKVTFKECQAELRKLEDDSKGTEQETMEENTASIRTAVTDAATTTAATELSPRSATTITCTAVTEASTALTTTTAATTSSLHQQ